MQQQATVPVVLMHRNPLLAAGMRSTLARVPDFAVQLGAPAGAGADAGHWLATGPPAVLVADFRTGMALARQRAAGAAARGDRIILVTLVQGGWPVRQALQQGVHGFLAADCALPELVEAVHSVHRGGRYLCATASRCMAESFAAEQLTQRELQVLQLLGEGLDNKSISRRMAIALGTVKVHVKALLDKLNASSRTEAVVTALRHGLLGDGMLMR